MLSKIGWSEILVILAIVLIFFGPKRIPELAKSIGQGIRAFKKGLQDVEKDIQSSDVDKSSKV